jgi:Protein of unknown function (DUF559)
MRARPQPQTVPGRKNEEYDRFFGPDECDALTALALAQHAVFDLEQLGAIGLAARAAQLRVEAGGLFRVYHSVYSLVPPPLLTQNGRFMAAVLACGPGAALSHRSAAHARELRRTDRLPIEVTIPGRSGRKHPGIEIHRSRTLTSADIERVSNIPCTTVARILFDLADVVNRRQHERAFDQAEAMGVLNMLEIEDQLARNAHRAAAPKIRALIDEHYIGTTVTDSDFEELLIPLIRVADLPMPATQAYIVLDDGEPPMRRDFVWFEQKVNVETDGGTHLTRQQKELDAFNDERLVAAGWRVIRITWKRLKRDPAGVIRTFAALLSG